MAKLSEHIVKLANGKYRLLSHTGKNLGTFDSHEAAAKHEGEVEYFKKHEQKENRKLKGFTQYLSEDHNPAQFEAKLNSFVAGCQKIIDDHYKRDKLNMAHKPTLRADKGKKFVKVVVLEPMTGTQARSVYCFVDITNGDVLKSASWSAPAKGARGNIFDSHNGLARMSPYGAGYNRGGNSGLF